MDRHRWMQSRSDTALCPRCGEYALRRSSAHGMIENYRKKRTTKRPFRCQQCGWRGWTDEGKLKYPSMHDIAVTRNDEIPAENSQVTLPGLDLEFSPVSEDELTLRRNRLAREMRERDEQEKNGKIASRHEPPSPTDDTSITQEAGRSEVPSPKSSSLPEDDSSFTTIPIERPSPVQIRSSSSMRGTGRGCPKCGDPSLHRSHARGLKEKLRKMFTNQRPYRCHKCAWRGWVPKVGH